MNKTMKTLVAFLVLFAVILTATVTYSSQAAASGTATALQSVDARLSNAIVFHIGSSISKVNGLNRSMDKNPLVAPYFKKGKLMAPVTFFVESLGGKVAWNAKANTAEITYGNTKYYVQPGSAVMTYNGKSLAMGAEAEFLGGRLFVPVRTLAETFGKQVFYKSNVGIVSDYKDIIETKDTQTIPQLIASLNPLKRVTSLNELKTLLTQYQNNYGDTIMKAAGEDAAPPAAPNEAAVSGKDSATNGASSDGSTDYSATNVQVEGVDEGDIVKTDGHYIYQVNGTRIVIVEAYPAQNMKMVSEIVGYGEKLEPIEIYVDDNRLVVIGRVQQEIGNPVPMTDTDKAGVAVDQKAIMPGKPGILPYYYRNETRVLVFDITDKSKPQMIRSFDVEGDLIASRKIGNTVYTITNKYMYYGYAESDITPKYRDGGTEYKSIAYDKIAYSPDFIEPNYLIVSGINVNDTQKPAEISTYLGAGQTVYASVNNLYIATQRSLPVTIQKDDGKGIVSEIYYTENTDIMKFALTDGKAVLLAKGNVPGRVLNQFSMDEFENTFRIATTVGWADRSQGIQSGNHLYVLDDMMNPKGKIENLAPGEQIYSVRFLGKRAYMVTFKTVDPLFVIDLADPAAPKVLGELKIPGYSTYLHPYDENHILGFGKDAVELETQWDPGTKWAYYQGLKVALFDVTDVANPVMQYSIKLGDRGTNSEVLYNHRALLFSKEKELLAFPVDLMEVKQNSTGVKDPLAYGEQTFQGLYIYQINKDTGFTFKGRITHTTPTDIYNYDKRVSRGIYIGNTLYTLSNQTLMANDLTSLELQKTLELK